MYIIYIFSCCWSHGALTDPSTVHSHTVQFNFFFHFSFPFKLQHRFFNLGFSIYFTNLVFSIYLYLQYVSLITIVCYCFNINKIFNQFILFCVVQISCLFYLIYGCSFFKLWVQSVTYQFRLPILNQKVFDSESYCRSHISLIHYTSVLNSCKKGVVVLYPIAKMRI